LDKDSECPRGIDSLYAVVEKNLNYTETAIRNGVYWKLALTFSVIDIAGEVTNPKVVGGIREDLN
jgi:hypothetical protein